MFKKNGFTSINRVLLRLQHTTAAAAPFIQDYYSALAVKAKEVLASIPNGLKAEQTNYPVLRVFASWPGDAKLGRTITWKENKKRQSQTMVEQESDADHIPDPDLHPLATLNLRNFGEAGETLDANWFQGDVQQMVWSKRVHEGDSELRVRKSPRVTAASTRHYS